MTRGWRRLAGVETRGELTAAALMLITYPLMLLAALLPHLGFFVVVAAVGYGADHVLHRRRAPLINRLSKARAGLSIRFLIRQLLLVLLLVRLEPTEPAVLYTAITAFLLFYALQAPHAGLVTLLRRARRLPYATRNVDLTTLRIPDGAPRGLTHRASEKILHTDLPLTAGIVTAAATGSLAPVLVGAAVTLSLALGYLLVLLPFLRRGALPPPPEEALAWLDEWFATYQPRVALYFSGGQDAAYQLNMWLETAEQLDERAVVILRERAMVPRVATTTLPVLCVPSAVDLMNLDLTTLRVGLYPANVGKNLHLLRVPTMRHVFVGHGDSDKAASINPYAKAYDEVWTAGRAGRDRYALADIGVRDDDIVEVGRPQLAPIRGARELPEDGVPTVLYAPTWEGWTDEPGNTSLTVSGEHIVRALLESERPVRVLYKPHPFTGIRCAEARAAHQRIVALIAEANAARAAEPRWSVEAGRSAAERARARETLERIDRSREAETVADDLGTWDDAAISRDALTPPERAAAEERLREERDAAYWRSFDRWEHQVVTGPEPGLYDCFNQSYALISDISSVVSDFIASGKPYAVTDAAELGADEFRRQNTAVRAAVILGTGAEGVPELVAAVFDPAGDTFAGERVRLRAYLLGPDEPSSLNRFRAAVTALAHRAEARNLAQEGAASDSGPAASAPQTVSGIPPARASAPSTDPVGTDPADPVGIAPVTGTGPRTSPV